jgi:hypothetical protein
LSTMKFASPSDGSLEARRERHTIL